MYVARCADGRKPRRIIFLGNGRSISYARFLLAVTDRRLVVHHINGNTLDDRLENLQPMTDVEHKRLHGRKLRAHMLGNQYHLGFRDSDQARKKKSNAHKGKRLTPEHRWKISEGLMGRIHSEETRRKIGLAGRGRFCSEETRRKMSEAHKKRG